MLSYCLKCKTEKTESKKSRIANTKKRKPMVLSKCAVCGFTKSRFIEEQEASGLLLGLNSPLKKVPLLSAMF